MTSANRSEFSFLRTLTTWHCPPAVQQSFDISCPTGPTTATGRSGFAAEGPCRWAHRRKDGRIPYRYTDLLHILCRQCQQLLFLSINIRSLLRGSKHAARMKQGDHSVHQQQSTHMCYNHQPFLHAFNVPRFESHCGRLCLSRQQLQYTALGNFRRTQSPSQLASSEGWRPPGAQSTFIKWTGWTLALSWLLYYYLHTIIGLTQKTTHGVKSKKLFFSDHTAPTVRLGDKIIRPVQIVIQIFPKVFIMEQVE